MKQEELDKILELHKEWLCDSSKGERANLIGANLIGANLYSADLRYADFRGANLRGADLCYADLRGADLSGTDLRGANLRGANFSDADFSGANFSGANFRGANLSSANLSGADLENTNIKSFQLSKHFAFFHERYLQIGCKGGSLDYWLENYNEIGRKYLYTKSEIEEYGNMIKLLKGKISWIQKLKNLATYYLTKMKLFA